eukprot:COSAG04_NODE_11192_length_724_cov_1.860800_2_plen_96_part_01
MLGAAATPPVASVTPRLIQDPQLSSSSAAAAAAAGSAEEGTPPEPALNSESEWVKYVGTPVYDANGARVDRVYFRHRLREELTIHPPKEWVREVRD